MEFLRIQEGDLPLILKWRTSQFVTRYMFTDIESDLDKQKIWFENIKDDTSSRYWILAIRGKKIGLMSLNDLDERNCRASWAFYIGEEKYSMVAGLVAPHLYNYAFQQLGLHKLTGEVLGGNEAVRKMHLAQGCRQVGYYKDHIFKYGQFHDVYIYEMLAQDWEQQPKKWKTLFPSVE